MIKVKISELLFPPRCVACDELVHYDMWKFPFCEICAAKWEMEKTRCRRENYGQPVRVVEPIEQGTPPLNVLYLLTYIPGRRKPVGNALILCMKDIAERRAVAFAGAEFASMLRGAAPIIAPGGAKHNDAVITWIPRSRFSVRKYGFDHMERVAKALSREIGIPALALLKRRFFTAEQKYLSTSERRRNAMRTMKISRKYAIEGKTVILIDDVVTSGASFSAAAKLLTEAGAEQVIAAALAATEHLFEDGERDIEDNFNIIKNSGIGMHGF